MRENFSSRSFSNIRQVSGRFEELAWAVSFTRRSFPGSLGLGALTRVGLARTSATGEDSASGSYTREQKGPTQPVGRRFCLGRSKFFDARLCAGVASNSGYFVLLALA